MFRSDEPQFFIGMDIESLINRHKNAVYGQLIRTCGSHEDAEDALIEAMLRAYKASDQLQSEESFKPWLASIARRVCAKVKAKERLKPVLELDALGESGFEPSSETPNPEDEMILSETKDCIRSSINILPESYRQIYMAAEINGWPLEKIAEHYEMSLPAGKSRLYRARVQVRQALDERLCFG